MGRVSDLLKSWPCGFVGDELVDNQRLDLKEAMDCRWDILREHRKRFEAIPHPQQELPLAGTRKVGNMGVLWHSRNNDARKIIPQDDLGAFVQCMTQILAAGESQAWSDFKSFRGYAGTGAK